MQQDKQEQARHLYFAQAKTQKEIAHLLDVSEKTIYNWIKRHAWDKLRQAARQAPALIAENLASQLVELQNSITRREPGCRFATMEESQIMLRLVTMMEKMKKFPGLSVNSQVLETFRNWMRPRDKSFTRDLSLYASLFLQGCAQGGYRPYELEFGIDGISPMDTFYEEEPIKEDERPAENITGQPTKQQPENTPTETSQSTDNHTTYKAAPSFPPPERTGKKAAIPDRTNDFPWRKRLHDLAQKKKHNSTKFSPRQNPRKE